MKGFRTGVYSAVHIVVGVTYDLKVDMKVGAVEQSVKVEAGQQVLETVQTSISKTISCCDYQHSLSRHHAFVVVLRVRSEAGSASIFVNVDENRTRPTPARISQLPSPPLLWLRARDVAVSTGVDKQN